MTHEPTATQILNSLASQEQQQQITNQQLIVCAKEYFPQLQKQLINNSNPDIVQAMKKLAQSYISVQNLLKNTMKNQSNIGAQITHKQQNTDLQVRKNTRATFAMRNSKNQQQLKKDQIFVRLIPRTHNCIHFMVKNQNFPRIQCKLSCNQHLQYLITYLTNKWLRGKVRVGYQIKLYPDPSTYMHKYSSESKRPSVIYEPLNNYYMFTDIMATFGIGQNGYVNLLYDITEMRKQKNGKIKERIQIQRESNYGMIHENVSMLKEPFSLSHQAFPKKQKNSQSFSFPVKSNENQKINLQSHDEFSIGISKDKKNYHNPNSIDYSQVNSINYPFNAYNSNHIYANLFNVNNSNTFLNPQESQKPQSPMKIVPTLLEKQKQKTPEKAEGKEPNSQLKVSPSVQENRPASIQNKLQNIRNFISIIQREKGIKNDTIQEMNDKEENSMNKSESNITKKQVKTVTIIKKKNND